MNETSPPNDSSWSSGRMWTIWQICGQFHEEMDENVESCRGRFAAWFRTHTKLRGHFFFLFPGERCTALNLVFIAAAFCFIYWIFFSFFFFSGRILTIFQRAECLVGRDAVVKSDENKTKFFFFVPGEISGKNGRHEGHVVREQRA